MRQLARSVATVAVASAMLTGAAIIAAPAASAVPPGGSFQWGALGCKATAANGNGTLTCSGTQNGWWRARVKCSFGFTYYGNWQNNYLGGTLSSTANSGCFWGVEDITISVPS